MTATSARVMPAFGESVVSLVPVVMPVLMHAALPSAAAVPRAPSAEEESVTVLPASAVPVKVGVASLVMSSVSEAPVSEAAARSGVEGAAGAAVSITILCLPPANPPRPAPGE